MPDLSFILLDTGNQGVIRLNEDDKNGNGLLKILTHLA